jgi:hypothetical protein
MEARTFDLPLALDRSSWDGHGYDHGPSSHANSLHEDHLAGFWKSMNESPVTPGFSPYAVGPPRVDAGWPLPARSLSFGNLDELPHPLEQYQPAYPADLRRRASDMLPPSHHASTAAMADLSVAAMSAQSAGQSLYQYGLPQAWNVAPGPPMMAKPLELAGWYAEPGQLAKVQEEELGTHFGQDPSILYASVGHH